MLYLPFTLARKSIVTIHDTHRRKAVQVIDVNVSPPHQIERATDTSPPTSERTLGRLRTRARCALSSLQIAAGLHRCNVGCSALYLFVLCAAMMMHEKHRRGTATGPPPRRSGTATTEIWQRFARCWETGTQATSYPGDPHNGGGSMA